MPSEKDTSASNMLTNGDLLRKILLRLGCPSNLVSVALTSKHWMCGTSEQASHPSGLLGVYISSFGISGSEFIPFLQHNSSSPNVSDVLADFGFGVLPAPNVLDCQNGVVLFEFGGKTFHPDGFVVRSPLRYPNMDKAMVLPQALQLPSFSEYPHAMLLPTSHDDDALCYRVDVHTYESDNKVTVLVYVLRSGSWAKCCIARAHLSKSPIKILPTTVLDGDKLYMATQAGFILGLNLTTGRLFIIDLPKCVEDDQYTGNLVHCRRDDSVLYLFHVDGDNKLNIWLHRMNDYHGDDDASGSTNLWVLKDTISLRETCGHLMEQGQEMTSDDDEDAATIMVVGAGDNAEFVFLELGITGIIMYMHLKTRKVKQVYQREPDDDYFISVRPFMFVRPPVFLAQDAHEGEAALHQE